MIFFYYYYYIKTAKRKNKKEKKNSGILVPLGHLVINKNTSQAMGQTLAKQFYNDD